MLFVGSVSSLAPDLRVKYLQRYLAPHVLSAVARRYRDFASSEDAVQEALIAAGAQWPRSGVPNNLVGWYRSRSGGWWIRFGARSHGAIVRRAVLEESAIATPGPDAEFDIDPNGVDPDAMPSCTPSPSTKRMVERWQVFAKQSRTASGSIHRTPGPPRTTSEERTTFRSSNLGLPRQCQ